jgi:hypothetical protein
MRHLFQRRLWGIPVSELVLVGMLLTVIVAASSWGLSGVLGEEETAKFTKTSGDFGEYITDPNEVMIPAS